MSQPHYADDAVTLYHGDCLDVLAQLADSSVDAVVTDPPYGLGFMGREWDNAAALASRPPSADETDERFAQKYPRTGKGPAAVAFDGQAFQAWCESWAAECLRVLKPGGHLLAFGGTRTWHRLAVAVEDAGFEVRDSIAWLYGSGFPKSLDVGKAIDKGAATQRTASLGRFAPEYDATAPATDDARTWQGWGTALKPAFEPIVVARKPLTGTVAGNVLQYGTGALNIDACRIPTDDNLNGGTYSDGYNAKVPDGDERTGAALGMYQPGARPDREFVQPAGRWPANVTLDPTQAAELDRQSGTLTSGVLAAHHKRAPKDAGILGAFDSVEGERGYGDSGGASRFFPTFTHTHHPDCGWAWCENTTPHDCGHDPATPSDQCEYAEWDCAPTCPLRPRILPTFRYEAKAPTTERPRAGEVAHPTVKPLDLMRWLVRLVTPPGGLVLDPFAGSGTTAEACVVEGFRCVTIEREADYLPLIVARLSKPIQPGLQLDFGEPA